MERVDSVEVFLDDAENLGMWKKKGGLRQANEKFARETARGYLSIPIYQEKKNECADALWQETTQEERVQRRERDGKKGFHNKVRRG